MQLSRAAVVVTALLGVAARPPEVDAQWLREENPVSEASNPKYDPALLYSGTDGVIVAWTDDTNYDASTNIYATRILLTGERDARWPATGLPVCAAPGRQFAPRLVSDGLGGAIVLWVDLRDGLYGVFAQRLTMSGSIDPGWPANGLRLCADVGGIVEAVSDGQGGAIAVWRDVQSGSSDIRAQRVAASGGIPSGWPQHGVVLVEGTSQPSLFVRVVSDGQGGAIVSWYTLAGSIDIYAQRVSATGVIPPGWPAAGLLVCGAPDVQVNPSAASDGSGGAFIAWSDLRTGNEDIYAAHVLAGGNLNPEWPANGVLVCAAQNVQQSPRTVSDQAGGCFAVWMDFRSGASYDVYAQRITGSGVSAAGWSQDGEPLCTAVGHQSELAAISDGAGGMISTWRDARKGPGDIYAHRIKPDGSTAQGWAADGALVSDAAEDQSGPFLVADGREGAVLFWGDYRFGQNDVYGQRISASGVLGPDIPPEPMATRLELLNPRPNPMQDLARLTVRLPVATVLTLDVLDLTGRRVASLQNCVELPSGDHTFNWGGLDDHGRVLPAGIYMLRASTRESDVSRKIVKL